MNGVCDRGIVRNSHLTMSAQVNSVVNSDQSSVPWPRTRPRWWSRCLHPYAWTTATHCFTAKQMFLLTYMRIYDQQTRDDGTGP